MQNFFCRNAIKVSCIDDFANFKSLASSTQHLFVKENIGSFGKNAQLLKLDSDIAITTAFDNLISSKTEWIVEECIIQSSIMSRWNADSVNTVRIPSLLRKKHGNYEHLILQPFMRSGRAGNIIDNAGSGGIFALINPNNGIIISDGYSEDTNIHKIHPDSKHTFKGFKIPDWEGLKQLTFSAHKKMENHPYIAFDFAHTPTGWILVEGNWGQFLGQYVQKQGVRKEFELFCKQ